MSTRNRTLYARAKKAIVTAAASSRLAYRLSRQIVYRHDGDNDGDMFTNGEHCVMQLVLPGAQVVFDVGANVGDWLQVACSINPRAEYHAFEPSGATYAKLASRSFAKSVRLVNAGLGADDAESELFIYGAAAGTNSVYQRRGTSLEVRERESIKIVALDHYCRDNGVETIDFMKIDVEGHELAVLRGAKDSLARGAVKVIAFEYGGTFIDSRTLLADVWDLVHSLNSGYQFFKVHHDGPRRVSRYRQHHETFQYSNWLIVASDHHLALS